MAYSLQRQQVDEALAELHTTLEGFVAGALDKGLSMEAVWMELRRITHVPFSVRTLYRWIDETKVQA